MFSPIVITTINEKTEGICRFEQITPCPIIIVGDKKTPRYETTDRIEYLGVDEQASLGFSLVDRLPFNHYCRKNIGYLHALRKGAQTVYDTDDDNLPYDDWSFDEFFASSVYSEAQKYTNVYRRFTDAFVWPRGFPLDEIRRGQNESDERSERVEIGVWQGLADGDPDVDAIYRLVLAEPVTFDRKPPVALPRDTYCPFNSQNTMWRREATPYLYLPVTVSFRFTDILRGYVAQRLMWEQGLHLGFTRATVYQNRNEHDLMRDFTDEIECYRDVRGIVDLLDAMQLTGSPTENLLKVYTGLIEADYVHRDELSFVSAWIDDLHTITCQQDA